MARDRAEMRFTNELGNKIVISVEHTRDGHLITMEGPSSVSQNTVTEAELDNLFRVIGAYLGAPVRAADVRPAVMTVATPGAIDARMMETLARKEGDAAHLDRLVNPPSKTNPLGGFTDSALVDALADACDAYEDVVEGLNESGGAGGSPLEGVGERVEEIVTEMKSRGLSIPSWATTPGGRRPKEDK